MNDKIWHVCIPIIKEPGIRRYFLLDFCMEILITVQPALALPVFLHLMLAAYEADRIGMMVSYAALWFAFGGLFLTGRYWFDVLVNGKFYNKAIENMRDICLGKIYEKDENISSQYDANPYYAFLSDEVEVFIRILFLIDRLAAVLLVSAAFFCWTVQISGGMALLALSGGILSVLAGNFASQKLDRENEEIFRLKTQLNNAFRILFHGTGNYLVKGKYWKAREKCERNAEEYNTRKCRNAERAGIRTNVLSMLDCAIYMVMILWCRFFVSENTESVILTMIAACQTMKGYMNRGNSVWMLLVEKGYVVDHYCERIESGRRKPYSPDKRSCLFGRTDISSKPGISGRAVITAELKTFTANQEGIAAGREEITVGRKEIAAGREEIMAGREEITSGREEITAGREEIAAGREEIVAGREEITANQEESEKKQTLSGGNMIEICNLCYRAGGSEILKNINMVIGQNEKVALIGLNGAGKSTLLRCILRLLQPTGGEIKRKKPFVCSYVPVNPQLFPVSINENIGYAFGDVSDSKNPDMEDIIEAAGVAGIDSIGLNDALKDGEENLSGGEAQRVAIARAFAGTNRLMVADEPTANLDIRTEKKVIRELFRRSGTLLYTTHNPALAPLADRVYILKRGRIAACGTPDEVCSLPVYREWEREALPSR